MTVLSKDTEIQRRFEHVLQLSLYYMYGDFSGTFELGDEEQEEIYEVINIGKIKAHTPNLRIINLYGISFVDDSHVDMLSNNCIHLESLSLNFCLKVKGSSMKNLIYRCRKLKTLLLQHCS